MGRLTIAWLLGVGLPAVPPGEPALDRFELTQVEMAVPVKIVLYAPDATTATRAAKAALARVCQLNSILSDYDPESELRRLESSTQEGGTPVSEDLWRVLAHAQGLSERSEGGFDVTVGPVVRLWRRARRRTRLPSPERLTAARQLVDYRLVRLDPQRHAVRLLKPGMRLDLGGIAKGYAVDEALVVLKKAGIHRALVDAGGDIALGDPPPGKSGWRIGIARLEADRPSGGRGSRPPDGKPSRVLMLSRVAIATSGDTWQYVEIGGRRYSHIVDPRTGLGLTDHGSVTVVAPRGITADGLASAISVLGPEKGLKLIENTPGAAAFIVRAPQGRVETYESTRWKTLRLQTGSDLD